MFVFLRIISIFAEKIKDNMTEAKDLIISIGTNVDQSINMFMGKQRLEELFHNIQ